MDCVIVKDKEETDQG